MQEPQIQNNRVIYFLFRVRLRRDPTAVLDQADQTGYLPSDPAAGCREIIRGNAQRMCRNPQTFSWEPCHDRP